MSETEKPTGLALLRVPFEAHQISKLPKPTKKQTDEVRADFKKGIRCKICGGWHHPDVVHLDYVGHAALTDRLLDCDPEWNWEPLAVGEDGAPKLDNNGGMWIRLTVCGVSRLGYGHPDGKSGGDAIKEVIGDALRNAAMRFGAALDLWHKGKLHDDSTGDGDTPPANEPKQPAQPKSHTPHPDAEDMLDWGLTLSAEDAQGNRYEVGTLGKADSKAVFATLQTAMRSSSTPAELHHWAHESAAQIWSLNATARHHLRERFDAMEDHLKKEAA